MTRNIKMILSLAALFTLAGCTADNSESEESPSESEENSSALEEEEEMQSNQNDLTVITTFYPVYEFTQQVAGDTAHVNQMISGGTDVHHYEPSARDIAAINEADVFIYSSGEMETWVDSMLMSLDNEELIVVEQAEQIELKGPESLNEADGHNHEEESHSHDLDPHIWLDPVLAQDQVETIKEALIEADANNSETYTANAAQFIEELEALHGAYETAFEGATERRFVTQHESFGYLADRYDLIQLAVGGLSTEVEPSPARIAEISHFVEDYDIPVIYYQEGADSAIAQTVAQETGTEIEVLYDLEVLPQELAESDQGYIEAMRENLEALQRSIR